MYYYTTSEDEKEEETADEGHTDGSEAEQESGEREDERSLDEESPV